MAFVQTVTQYEFAWQAVFQRLPLNKPKVRVRNSCPSTFLLTRFELQRVIRSRPCSEPIDVALASFSAMQLSDKCVTTKAFVDPTQHLKLDVSSRKVPLYSCYLS